MNKRVILMLVLVAYIPFVLLFVACEKPEQERVPLLQQLGKTLIAERSNNVSYEWYISQTTTGEYSSKNCGPTCITMACKWANPNFTKTVEDARNDYLHLSTSGWSWIMMGNYLIDNGIDCEWDTLSDENFLKSVIDSGHICIVALDVYFIRLTTNLEWHIDRYYEVSPPAKHYIIVKGYKIVDDIIWFEVYDPASGWQRYKDGTYMGRDRYYRGTEIINASNISSNDSGYPYSGVLIVQK